MSLNDTENQNIEESNINIGKRKRDDDEESIGSLKDFIVPDDDENNNDDNISDVDETIIVKKAKEDPETIELLKQEAEKFSGIVSGTVIGGRTLRSRAPEKIEARKPRDSYYERFGRAAEEQLMEKFTKKDIIEFVKKLEHEHRLNYENAGHTWPQLNARMSIDNIRKEYDAIKLFLDLPDSDEETDEIEPEDTEDETLSEEDDDDSIDECSMDDETTSETS